MQKRASVVTHSHPHTRTHMVAVAFNWLLARLPEEEDEKEEDGVSDHGSEYRVVQPLPAVTR